MRSERIPHRRCWIWISTRVLAQLGALVCRVQLDRVVSPLQVYHLKDFRVQHPICGVFWRSGESISNLVACRVHVLCSERYSFRREKSGNVGYPLGQAPKSPSMRIDVREGDNVVDPMEVIALVSQNRSNECCHLEEVDVLLLWQKLLHHQEFAFQLLISESEVPQFLYAHFGGNA